MNELLWLALLTLCFISIISLYRYFGKVGLYVWLVLALMMSNIQTIRIINLFSFEIALGIIFYSTTFTIIDILLEKHGKKEAQNAVVVATISMIITTLLMHLTTYTNPSINDITTYSFNLIFFINIRIFIATVIAFFISHWYKIIIYEKIKNDYRKSYIVSGDVSTIISQLIDTMLFIIIAFIGTYPLSIMIELFIAKYVFKFIVAILDTAVLYFVNKIDPQQ
ncbi:MAG: queuosine precursor transporter [Bacilli bacterium]|jgi:uncharacterized integral membrane protein (TIGR00697 family)